MVCFRYIIVNTLHIGDDDDDNDDDDDDYDDDDNNDSQCGSYSSLMQT